MRRRTEEKRRPYFTFEGVKLHMRDGSVIEDEILSTLVITEKGCPLGLPRKNYKSRRAVAEEVHDFLYNVIKRGDEISWVELLNVKEYK